jgi:hypothetical protein
MASCGTDDVAVDLEVAREAVADFVLRDMMVVYSKEQKRGGTIKR